MSAPDAKAELHELVHDYCHEWLGEASGETSLVPYLHDEIDHPEKRSSLYDEFMEWLEN